jgi:hypothetical protein
MADVVERAHGRRSTTYCCGQEGCAQTHTHTHTPFLIGRTTHCTADAVPVCREYQAVVVVAYNKHSSLDNSHHFVIEGLWRFETVIEDEQSVLQRRVVCKDKPLPVDELLQPLAGDRGVDEQLRNTERIVRVVGLTAAENVDDRKVVAQLVQQRHAARRFTRTRDMRRRRHVLNTTHGGRPMIPTRCEPDRRVGSNAWMPTPRGGVVGVMEDTTTGRGTRLVAALFLWGTIFDRVSSSTCGCATPFLRSLLCLRDVLEQHHYRHWLLLLLLLLLWLLHSIKKLHAI